MAAAIARKWIQQLDVDRLDVVRLVDWLGEVVRDAQHQHVEVTAGEIVRVVKAELLPRVPAGARQEVSRFLGFVDVTLPVLSRAARGEVAVTGGAGPLDTEASQLRELRELAGRVLDGQPLEVATKLIRLVPELMELAERLPGYSGVLRRDAVEEVIRHALGGELLDSPVVAHGLRVALRVMDDVPQLVQGARVLEEVAEIATGCVAAWCA